MASTNRSAALLAVLITLSCACIHPIPPAPSVAGSPATAASTTAPTVAEDEGLEGEAGEAHPWVSACKGDAPLMTEETPAQVLQMRHGGGSSDVVFSADGLLATRDPDRTVRIWDIRTRSLLRSMPSSKRFSAAKISWSSEAGRLLVFTGSEKLTVDLEGNVVERARDQGQFLGSSAGPLPVQLQSDFSGNVFVYKDRKGMEHKLGLPRASMQLSRMKGDAFSPPEAVKLVQPEKLIGFSITQPVVLPDDSALVALTANDNALVVWSLADKMSEPTFFAPGAPIERFAVLPDGQTVAALIGPVGEQTLELLSLRPGKARKSLRPKGKTTTFALSPDGARVAVSSLQSLEVLELSTGKRLWTEPMVTFSQGRGRFEGEAVSQLVFSPDGTALLAERDEGTLSLYDAKTGKRRGTFGSKLRAPKELALLGRNRLAARSAEHVTIWSLKSGKVLATVGADDLASVDQLDDGSVVSVRRFNCGHTANVFLDRWQNLTPPDRLIEHRVDWTEHCPPPVPEGPPPTFFPPPPGKGNWPFAIELPREISGSVTLDARAGLLLVAGVSATTGAQNEGAAALFLTATKTWLSLRPPADSEFSGTPTLSGHLVKAKLQYRRHLAKDLYFSSALFDATTGAMLPPLSVRYTLMGDTFRTAGVSALSPDEATFAVAFEEYFAIRPTRGGDEQQLEVKLGATPTALHVANRGEWLLVGTNDGRLFRVTKGQVVASGASPGGPIRQILVDDEGGRVVTLSEDGTTRLWRKDNLKLEVTLADFDDDESIAFSPSGAYVGTAEVADRVAWVYGRPAEAFRFEQFAHYRSPSLVQKRLAGEDRDVTLEPGRPPRIEILEAPRTATAATVRVRARATSDGRVDLVKVFVEGREVVSRNVCATSEELSLDVPVLPGVNALTLVAFDSHGRGSNPQSLRITAPPSGSDAPTLYVTAMGVSHYPALDADAQLRFADADAEAIAARLRDLAGDGKPFGRAKVETLLNEAVTPEATLSALDRMKEMKPEDVAVIFMAGHGMKPSPDADMVFLTSESDGTKQNLRASGIGWEQLDARVSVLRGRVLLLLDACHSGHLSQQLVVPNGALAGALLQNHRAGVVVFSASKGRQPSFEPLGSRGLKIAPLDQRLLKDSQGHGVFTAALLASLDAAGTDSDGDGAIQLSEWIDDVTWRVGQTTRGEQTPWVSRRELFGDFRVAVASVPDR